MSSIRRPLFLIALWSVALSVGRAEEYAEYVSGTPTNPGSTVTSSASNIGYVINIAGFGNTPYSPSSALPGSFLIVDQNLDGFNSGTLSVVGGEIHQQHFSSIGIVANSPFLGTITNTGTGLQYAVSLAPTIVNSGNFTINSSTLGSFTLNGGTMQFSGTLLGQSFDGTLDFDAQPLTFSFSDLGQQWAGGLGASSLTGYADGNAAGTDVDTSSHGSNIPGTTGISTIDTDGAELLINLNGLTAAANLTIQNPNGGQSLVVPVSIQLTGSVYVSVPELSSVTLIGGAMSWCSLLWLRRSKM